MDRRYLSRRGACVAAIVLAMAWSGCQENDLMDSRYAITEDEAAAIITNTFGSNVSTYGLTAQIEELSGIVAGGALQKGSGNGPDTVTITRSRTGVYNYAYKFHFSYGMVGSSFDVLYDMRGTYDIPGISSEDTSHSSLEFSDLPQDTLLVNGYSWRFGLQNDHHPERRAYDSEILATLNNVSVSQSGKMITGGAVSFTMIERFPDGFVVSLPGLLTYLDGHRAFLIVNRKPFNVDLDSARATAATETWPPLPRDY